MPDRVLLKQDFDAPYKSVIALVDKLTTRVDLEVAKPTLWTRAQGEVIRDIVLALSTLTTAVGEMAAHVRDD
jgi:hypothetical protein